MSDFIPRYDPATKAMHQKYAEVQAKVMDNIAKARNEWTDRIMQAILPDALYNMAKSNRMSDRKKVAHWMKKNKVRFALHPDFTEITRHGEILGRFTAGFKDGKMAITATIRKGLATPVTEAQSPNSDTTNLGLVPPIEPPDASPDKGGAS